MQWQFGELQIENYKGELQMKICKKEIVLRRTDGRRSNIGLDCSKTNF